MTDSMPPLENGVAEIVLDGAGPVNALTLDACRRLRERTEALRGLEELRVVLLRSEGVAFCVGGDLREMAQADDPAGHVAATAGALHDAILNLKALDVPIVVAIQGAAAGAGLGLAALGDLVFASPKARFAWAYTAVGLSADAGCTWLLPRLIGLRLTQAMALEGRTLDAAEAAAAGLVTAVVEDGALLATARAAAARLAAGPKQAWRQVRALLAAGEASSLADQLDRERASIAELAASPDGREGVAAFLARRPPRFTS